MNLTQFIQSDLRNAWIKERYISVYVRKSMRLLGESVTPCLDIANVEVVESKRGVGVFTSFRGRFEKAAKQCGRWAFVECVQNRRLADHLPSVGYYRSPRSSSLLPDFFKPTD